MNPDYKSSLNVGDDAPLFRLPDQHEDLIGLADFDGRWVVVWWMPSTMVEHARSCSDHVASQFAHHLEGRPELGVLGLSFDPPELSRAFVRRGALPFPMLTADVETGTDYGVYRGDEDEWNCFPRKRAFLVAPDGRIAKVYLNIDPELFVHEVLNDLEELVPRRGFLGRALAVLKG